MMTKMNVRTGAVAPLLVSVMALAAVAQTEELPPVVVEATRVSQPVIEIPSQVTLVSAEDIFRSGAVDTVQALERLGGLYFRRNGNPAEAELVMGGFSEQAHGRTLILVDGQRLNQPDMRAPNWSAVPVESIERIEVLHGAQTVLYGNFAVAGVVNIITRQDAAPLTSLTVSGGSENTYGTHVHHNDVEGDTSYSVNAGWQKSDGWRENSQYEIYDVRGMVRQKINDGFSVWIGGFYNWGNLGLPGAISAGAGSLPGDSRVKYLRDPRQAAYPDDEMTVESYGATTGMKMEAEQHEFYFDANVQRRLQDFTQFSSYTEIVIDEVSVSPRYKYDGDVAGHRTVLVAGLDGGVSTLDYTRRGGTDSADLQRQNGALFLRNEFYFTDALSLIAGGRWEGVRTKADGAVKMTSYDPVTWESVQALHTFDQSRTETLQAYEVGLMYAPDQQQKYFVRGTTLYRYPFMDELFSYQGIGTPGLSEDLRAEKGMLLEAGFAVMPVDGFAVDMRVYRLAMQDEMAWDGNRNVNLDRTTRYGLDVGVNWRPVDELRFRLGYQWVQAEFAAGAHKGKSVPLVPEHVVTLYGEQTILREWSLMETVRAVSRQYMGGDNGNAYRALPGYVVADVGVRYSPKWVDGFSVLFSCDNVFDTTYATSAFGLGYEWGGDYDGFYPANGRTWRITGRYQF